MAGRETKQQSRRRRRPSLDDDSLWLTLTWAHRTYSQHLDGMDFSPTANRKLFDQIKAEELSLMRISITDSNKREHLEPSFCQSPATLIAALSSSSAVSRTKAPGPIHGWTYYVSRREFEKYLGRLEPLEEISTGRKAKGNWKWRVACEIIQRLLAGKKFPTAKEMLDFCSDKIRHAPDPSDMRKHLNYLRGKKN